jgi:pimeloyl-ACP methyl ester carboxylesterase
MMDHHYIVCVRNVEKDGTFGSEPGNPLYLKVPDGEIPRLDHAVKKDSNQNPDDVMPKRWLKEVISKACTKPDAPDYLPTGNLLVFVHGYNTGIDLMVRRHVQLRKDLRTHAQSRKDLREVGFSDMVVSFAWPSAGNPLNYLEDRQDAKETAFRLVYSCIAPLAEQQHAGCRISVHVLAHSTGAFIVREAFIDADDWTTVRTTNWVVSQLMFIGADISSRSLSAADPSGAALFRHCIRLTNYWNPFDEPLSLSGVKRIGAAPRAGRIGLPADAASKAVDVNCGNYWEAHAQKRSGILGDKSHSWHFGDPVFAEDMVETMKGAVDRHYIRTREMDEEGRLLLTKPEVK